MVDKSLIGKEMAPFDMPVERGKIREFARATMSENAAYRDEPVPVSPPTFLTTMNFWMDESPIRMIGLDLKRVLHGGQSFRFNGAPPAAGTQLHASSSIESINEKEGKRGGLMTFVVVKTEFSDDDGNVVAESRSTIIETGKAPE